MWWITGLIIVILIIGLAGLDEVANIFDEVTTDY